MPKFAVTVLESRTHEYLVEARNADEAREEALAQYESDGALGDYLGGEVINVEEIEEG